MKRLLYILVFAMALQAQTEISGTVSGSWEWLGNPYHIVGDALVPASDTLVVRPQVVVRFMGEYRLTVAGRLEMIGADFSGPGEIFGDDGSMRIHSCEFDSLTEAIQCFGGDLLLCQNEIRYTTGTAVTIQDADSAQLCTNTIEYSGDYAVKVTRTDSARIGNNTLRYNSTNDVNHPALFIDSCSPQSVMYNRITDNHAQGIGIWALSSGAFPWIRYNLVARNFTGITIVNTSPVIEDNLILANHDPGNYNSGAGIYVGYSESYPLVNRNYIAGNYYGVSIINDAQPNLGDMVNDWPGDDGENLFYGNAFDHVPYNIWNGTPGFIMAQNNHWVDLDSSQVDSTIHDDDEGVGGEVHWWPIYAIMPTLGDPSGDEVVNILDVILLIETVLGQDLPLPVLFYQCDLNKDFELTVSDAVILIEEILDF